MLHPIKNHHQNKSMQNKLFFLILFLLKTTMSLSQTCPPCLYNGVEYPHGSQVNLGGVLYRCDCGVWVRIR